MSRPLQAVKIINLTPEKVCDEQAFFMSIQWGCLFDRHNACRGRGFLIY